MLFNIKNLATTASSALLVQIATASTIIINVGFNGTGGALSYFPDSTKAAVGDVVQFHYHTGNHNVESGPFGMPCASVGNGSFFNSGFKRVTAPSTLGTEAYEITINDTKPIWFFCAQHIPGTDESHCQAGMVGVINEPQSGPNTLAAYKANAAKVSSASNVFPDPFIGTNITISNSSTATTTATASATTIAPTASHSTAAAVANMQSNMISLVGIVAGGVALLF